MKINFTEISIEATASELQASRTLADNFTSLLSRCFQPTYGYNSCADDEDDEEANNGKTD